MEWLNEIPTFLEVTLAICVFIVSIASAVAIIVKLYRWMRKPTEETQSNLEKFKCETIDERQKIYKIIEEQQSLTNHVYNLLDNDKKRLDGQDESDRMIFKALWALLDHALTGNGDEKMKTIRDDLQQHILHL